jgi:hypothetical protein
MYDDLEDAALARSGEPSDRSPDPRESPAPGRLDVMEHRHELVRGLRWWVDAVHDGDEGTPDLSSPGAMAWWLQTRLVVMAAEDRAELADNLSRWLRRAWQLADPTPMEPGELFALPAEARGAVLPYRAAAKVLRVDPTTVLRRNGGKGGMVRLEDVAGPRCHVSDLPAPWCAHCNGTGCEPGA